MIKNKPRIKGLLSADEMGEYIRKIVAANFIEVTYEDGTTRIEYAPYMREKAEIIMFYLYYIDGVTFESIKDEDGNDTGILEDIYEEVILDDELIGIYESAFMQGLVGEQLKQISDYVDDIVDFKKEQLIHSFTSTLSDLLVTLNKKVGEIDMEKTISFVEKFEKANITPNSIVQAYMDQIDSK